MAQPSQTNNSGKLEVEQLVRVLSLSARNPGGYGRIKRIRTKRQGSERTLYRVDSSEFPGQEVTGWYPRDEIEPMDSSSDTLTQEIKEVLSDCYILRDLGSGNHSDFITTRLIEPLRHILGGTSL